MDTTLSPTLLEEIKRLSLDQQRQLRDALNKMLAENNAQDEAELEDKIDQEMLAEGILDHVPPPITDHAPFQNRQPVKVKGSPTSEILIEERR